MRPRAPLAASLLLVLAILSCAVPGAASLPTVAVGIPAAEPKSTEEPRSLPPVDFAEALDAQVAAGEIAYEEGLILLLRSFLGDPDVSLPTMYDEIATAEGNSLVARAVEYLSTGTDPAAQDEIRRLLGLIFPTTEQLDAYSLPADAFRRGPGLSRPVAQIDCADLWLNGFPLRSVTTYPCFSHAGVTVAGVATATVYFPAEWIGDPFLLLWFERARQAAEDSLRVMGAYGPFDDISLIFSTVPGARATFLATTHRYDLSAGETCPILIYPRALGLPEEHFKQAVAHEIFHCYQARNLTAQMTVPHDVRDWWSEGTATYFSNVVYPNANHEFIFVNRFDGHSDNTPLYRMDYDTFGFWQFLADRWGDNAVLTYLETMPASGGPDEQRDRLASTPGIGDIFHEFGKAYLDLAIADSGGANIPFTPTYEDVVEVPRGAFQREFTPEAFVLERHDLFFVDDTRFDIRRELTEGEGQDSANRGARPGAWGALPSSVNTACGEAEYLLLVTSTQPGGSPTMRLKVDSTGQPAEDNTQCDACVLGTWQLDNGSYLAHMGGVWSAIQALLPSFGLETEGARAYPTDVFGLLQITFKDDGTANGSQESWGISGIATGEDGTLHYSMTYNGGGEAAWRIEEDEAAGERYLFFERIGFSLAGQMNFEGMLLRPVPFGESNDTVFLSSPQEFLCDETTLTYVDDYGLGPVWFTRVAEESGAP